MPGAVLLGSLFFVDGFSMTIGKEGIEHLAMQIVRFPIGIGRFFELFAPEPVIGGGSIIIRGRIPSVNHDPETGGVVKRTDDRVAYRVVIRTAGAACESRSTRKIRYSRVVETVVGFIFFTGGVIGIANVVVIRIGRTLENTAIAAADFRHIFACHQSISPSLVSSSIHTTHKIALAVVSIQQDGVTMLLEVAHTVGSAGTFAGGGECRQQHCRQDGDNGDDDQIRYPNGYPFRP